MSSTIYELDVMLPIGFDDGCIADVEMEIAVVEVAAVEVESSLPLVKGDTPYIGENGNWWIAGVDTGKPSQGGGGTMVIDSIPTEGSTNAVSSGGVYDAIEQSLGNVGALLSII